MVWHTHQHSKNCVSRALCLQVRLVYSKVCLPVPPGIVLPPKDWVGRASIHSDFNTVLKFHLKMIYFTPCCSLCSKSNHCKLKSDFGSPHYNSSWRLRASLSGFKQEAMEFFLQGEDKPQAWRQCPVPSLKCMITQGGQSHVQEAGHLEGFMV